MADRSPESAERNRIQNRDRARRRRAYRMQRPAPETYEETVRFHYEVEMDTYWGLHYGANREQV